MYKFVLLVRVLKNFAYFNLAKADFKYPEEFKIVKTFSSEDHPDTVVETVSEKMENYDKNLMCLLLQSAPEPVDCTYEDASLSRDLMKSIETAVARRRKQHKAT